ncbi:NAD(P)-dependent oxidoreductase [Fibrella aquatilis]|uniref:NAD(P)H-binding protein n=1 Tax=Fibrella aquatilis TaxID=2817059 RepID=A0A939K2B4_9BACT|nr:NAD(P)H-binding protein [Fibrella aquatilis]MBO0933130.1 NAD(P)H-binding protein [Fibrella aquatilis]
MATPTNSTIAVLGGAGKAGRPLMEEALRQGYTVRALLRHPDQLDFAHERLTIIHSDARDSMSISQLLAGSAALISTLGNPKGENIPILSTVTSLILAGMKTANISRYVTLTSLYDTGNAQTDEKTRLSAAFMKQHFPDFMADRAREYALLRASNLNWTYVRVPYLVESETAGTVKTHLGYMPGGQLAVGDLARFLLEQLDNQTFSKQAPFIANA